ncbi:MAG: hypothetical protein QOF44_940 [Streptomyces sp.]|jgi:hypothetical protein|nr:hypothetical protein [Streptomyces sp.]
MKDATLGADFASRGRRAEAQAAALRGPWTQLLVTRHVIDNAGINPL